MAASSLQLLQRGRLKCGSNVPINTGPVWAEHVILSSHMRTGAPELPLN